MSPDASKTVPPHEPGHEHPPRRPLSFWKTYGIRRPVGFACALVVVLATIAAAVLILVPRIGTGAREERCNRNLSALGRLLLSQVDENGAFPTEGGAALLLRWRQEEVLPRGREYVLLCPLDRAVDWPRSDEAQDAYDEVDLSDPNDLVPRCSYAVRDFARFPVDADGTDPSTGELAWVMCDRQGPDGRTQHHPKGLHVLLADGSVRYVQRAELGLDPEDRIIVGPHSPHPELRKMIFFASNEDGAPSETTPR